MKRGIFNAIHIADIHFAAYSPKDQYDILKKQFLDKIYSYPGINLISVDGDLFDHKLMANSEGIYYASMFVDNLVRIAREKNCTLLLLHGTYSHDADQLKLFYHYMNDKTVDVRIITSIQFEQVGNCRILCIPELYGLDELVYNKYLHMSGYYDEAILHGTFEGSVYGNNVGNGRLFTLHDFDMCRGMMIGGHVHKPGCFEGYFYYCGCPYRWKFGEEEDKGFLICSHDLDLNRTYVNFETIISNTYITIEWKDAISNPKLFIDEIDKLKKEKGIDYLKVRFSIPVDGSDKTIINNYYRNSRNTYVEFLNIMEEEKVKAESSGIVDTDYAFLLDDKLSDMEKFVKYVNMNEGSKFITVDSLKEILAEQL